MSIIEDLPRKSPPMQRIWQGVFASSPTSQEQLVDVFLPDFSMLHRWKRCKWTPRFTEVQVNVAEGADTMGDTEGSHMITVLQILYPVRGNPCLCVFDNDRIVWVTQWWPYQIVNIGH
jgi:hypothetical protein